MWKVRGKARGSRWILPGFRTSVARGVIAGVLLLFAGIGVAMGSERDEIFSAVQAYTRAVYARDYAEAYRWIAAVDRKHRGSHTPLAGLRGGREDAWCRPSGSHGTHNHC